MITQVCAADRDTLIFQDLLVGLASALLKTVLTDFAGDCIVAGLRLLASSRKVAGVDDSIHAICNCGESKDEIHFSSRIDSRAARERILEVDGGRFSVERSNKGYYIVSKITPKFSVDLNEYASRIQYIEKTRIIGLQNSRLFYPSLKKNMGDLLWITKSVETCPCCCGSGYILTDGWHKCEGTVVHK